jgi:hypothetical protein
MVNQPENEWYREAAIQNDCIPMDLVHMVTRGDGGMVFP